MARVRGIPRGFRFPWRTTYQIHREVDDELRFHMESRIEELREKGLDPEAAERQALMQFGDLDGTRRSLKHSGRRGERQRRRQRMFEELWRDVNYAWRSLSKSPGFTAVAVIVLALGIGVNSAMFSLINMLMMRPVKIADPERIVGVYSQNTERPDSYRMFSYPTYVDIREQNQVFEELASFNITVVGVTEGGTTRRVMAGLVSANYFDAFGVPPARGRAFTLAEESPSGDGRVAVVSHDYWARNGADPELIGSTLPISGETVTVVGIAAEGFTGSTALISPDLWLPLSFFPYASGPANTGTVGVLDDRKNYSLMPFGRLREGIDAAAAAPELASLASRLEQQYPVAQEHQTFTVAPMSRLGVSNVPQGSDFLIGPALMMMAMTGVVLLIACLNLANMFLARGAARRTEMAIRLSLGGGRTRLLRQLLTEGLLLALAGGVLGLVLAYLGTRLLFSTVGGLVPFGISFVIDASPDLRVILATLGFCVLATLFFGLGPAWRLSGGDLVDGLKESAGKDIGAGSSPRLLAPRNLLIVAQIALSLVLLVAGGLFTRGALAAARATPGFSLEKSVLVELDPSLIGRDEAGTREVFRQVMSRIRALPGVESAGMASIVPFGAVTNGRQVQLAGETDPDAGAGANYYIVGDDYFESLRLPVLRGREFNESEIRSDDGPKVAIIGEPLAERLFPDGEALGEFIQIAASLPGREPVPLQVVGVVPGVRHNLWDLGPTSHLYVPYGQVFSTNMHVHVRVADRMGDDEAAMLATIRETIRSIDPALPVLTLKTMRDHRDESLFLWLVRAGAQVFSILGGLALFLALVGVYGVKAFVMSRRTREIGVRMALGATSGDVLRQMVREGLTLTLVGLCVGLLLAAATARLLSSFLYEVSAADPIVFVGAALLLATAATLASWLPARRVTKIAPTAALRHE